VRKISVVILVLSALVGSEGCKSPSAVTKAPAPAPSAKEEVKKDGRRKDMSERDLIELDYLFFNANKEKILGNYEAAYALFLQCLRKDPKNAAALYGLAQITSEQKRFQEALEFVKAAIEAEPKNSWYQSLYAEILQKNKRYSEAANVYANLVKENPESLEYYFEWASSLYFADKIPDAIKVYDKLEEKIGINPEVCIQKERLYVKLGKIDKAAAELQKLIDAFPQEPQYYGMLAELYQANGMSVKALELFNKVLQLDPDNSFVHLSLADYYRSIGNKEKSFEELRLVFSNKNTDIETKFKILSSYFNLLDTNEEIKEQALALNRILVETHPNESGAHVFYGEFLFQDKKFSDARTSFRRALELDNKNFVVWQQLMRTELELRDYSSLVKESEEALTLFPTQPLVYYLNGIGRIQEKQYREGIKVLESGLSLIVDNQPLQADFYANIGEAYYKLKEMKSSDKAFEKSIALEPKNANTLNNYSYYLSVRGDSLSKAEQLSRTSNELEPNNSHYQDTYGWILYKLGKYEEARTWIEKAINNRTGESAVILEHYGDILYKLGLTEQAFEYWQKAQKIGGGSEFLEKKLTDKKLYE
jgi:tetratricopeptide (TPR) repeat protein